MLARRSDPLDAADAFLTVIDTGSGWSGRDRASSRRAAWGWTNIESRLRHYFGASAAMAIRPTSAVEPPSSSAFRWTVGDRAMARRQLIRRIDA